MIPRIYTITIFILLSFFNSPTVLSAQEGVVPNIKGLPKDSAQIEFMSEMILTAHQNALCIINEIAKAYSGLLEAYPGRQLDSAWNAHPDFALWMGKGGSDPEFYEEVGNKITTLQDWLQNHQITYHMRLGPFSYCELTHSTAYTSQLSRQKVINLCPYWLKCRPKQQASTIIHELVHKMGHGHPEGTTYPSKAIILARTNPMKACKSPENYEGLAESFYCWDD